MLGSLHAQDDLARAARDDRGQDVRLYCITSLGKLRSRRHLMLLVRLYREETDPRLRLTIGQAVCRIVGIAHYEL